MGKKPSKSSPKISKAQKSQFGSLIKVLRPKVFITDISSFKKLVQDLTGNNGTRSFSPPPTNQIINPALEVYCIDHTRLGHHHELYSSTTETEGELSHDEVEGSTSTMGTSSPLESWNQRQAVLKEDPQCLNQTWDQVLMDLLAVRDIESWLLDF